MFVAFFCGFLAASRAFAEAEPPEDPRPYSWLDSRLIPRLDSRGESRLDIRPDSRLDAAPIAPFALTDHGGEVGIETDYLSESQKRRGSNEITFRNLSIEEYLEYRFNGYAYHPRLLDFRTRFRVGLIQQMIERSGGLDDEKYWFNSYLTDYEIYLRFFQKEPLSLDLISRRTRDVVRQLFTDRIYTQSEEHGALLHWKKQPFPMDLAYRRNLLKQWGLDSYSDSTVDTLEYSVRNYFRDRMYTELSYRYQDYEQYFEVSAPLVELERRTRFESHDTRLDNTLYFLGGKSTYLNSALHYFDQTGDQEIRNFSWWERLNLQHRKNLRTYYLFNLVRNEFERGHVNTYRAESGIDHRLYNSLDSHLDVHWRNADYVRAEDTEYGVTGRLNYRKSNPFGHLGMGYAITRNYLSRTGDSVVRNVIDEPLTLSANEVRLLGQRNPRPETIVVTDPSGQFLYTEGFDYIVEELGDRTGLRLLLGGLLDEGDTVLVDYEFDLETDPDIDYYTTDQSFSIRQDWNLRRNREDSDARSRLKRGSIKDYVQGLATYARWRDFRADGENGRAEDLRDLATTSWLVGFRYPWRWLAWTEEFEQYESFTTDYTQLRSQLEANTRITPRLHWGAQVGMLNVNYQDGDRFERSGRSTDIYYAATNLRGRFLRRGFWSTEVRGRKETGITEEMLLGFLGKIGLRWRRTKLSLGCRFEDRERFESRRSRIHVFLQLSREF